LLYCSSSIIPNISGYKIEKYEGNLTFLSDTQKKINKDNFRWFLSKVSVIFQFPDNNFVTNSVIEEFKLLKKLVPSNFFTDHDNLIKYLNIRELGNAKINELSEGQKQLISLSCCFLRNPEVIFLDEPLTMLDKINRSKFLSYLKIYNLNYPNTLIIISTHNPILFSSLSPIYYGFKKGQSKFIEEKYKPSNLLIKNGLVNEIDPYVRGAESSSFLKFENVNIWYKKDKVLKGLSNLNFSIKSGQNIILTGINGAGKSTLAQTISGLHKDYEGVITLNHKNISESKPIKENSIRLVTQIPGNQLIYDTVGEELRDAIKNNEQSYINGIIDEIKPFLAVFNIKLEDDPLLLSFGQQKIVALLSHLSFPKLLIIDEPTISCDAIQYDIILDIIKYYQQKGVTTIIISHDPEIFFSVSNFKLNLLN